MPKSPIVEMTNTIGGAPQNHLSNHGIEDILYCANKFISLYAKKINFEIKIWFIENLITIVSVRYRRIYRLSIVWSDIRFLYILVTVVDNFFWFYKLHKVDPPNWILFIISAFTIVVVPRSMYGW